MGHSSLKGLIREGYPRLYKEVRIITKSMWDKYLENLTGAISFFSSDLPSKRILVLLLHSFHFIIILFMIPLSGIVQPKSSNLQLMCIFLVVKYRTN